MPNYFVRINHRKSNKDDFYSEQVERRLYFNIDTKKNVLAKIKEDYLEYFSEKVPQRTVNGELFYVNVYELGEYWEKFILVKPSIIQFFVGSSISKLNQVAISMKS